MSIILQNQPLPEKGLSLSTNFPLCNEVLAMMGNGQRKQTIVSKLMDKGYTVKEAESAFQQANKLMKAEYIERSEQLVQYVDGVLNTIVEKCMENNRYGDALKALEQISKLGKLYDQNTINIQCNFGFNFDEPQEIIDITPETDE